jgi:hypothetical protein
MLSSISGKSTVYPSPQITYFSIASRTDFEFIVLHMLNIFAVKSLLKNTTLNLRQQQQQQPASTPIPMNYGYPDQAFPPLLTTQQQNPVRQGNMFGPYLLLQTLGEGEFGKVKLGMRIDTSKEVSTCSLYCSHAVVVQGDQECNMPLMVG